MNLPKRTSRGQMFMMAVLIIALYIIAITAALIELSTFQMNQSDVEQVAEFHRNVIGECEEKASQLLAHYTNNESGLTQDEARTQFRSFLGELETYSAVKGFDADFSIITELEFKGVTLPGPSNATDGVFSSNVTTTISILLRDVSEGTEILEQISISYSAVAILIGSRITVYVIHSSGSVTSYLGDVLVTASLSGSAAKSFNNGTYLFSTSPSGYLNVTLPNRISIYS